MTKQIRAKPRESSAPLSEFFNTLTTVGAETMEKRDAAQKAADDAKRKADQQREEQRIAAEQRAAEQRSAARALKADQERQERERKERFEKMRGEAGIDVVLRALKELREKDGRKFFMDQSPATDPKVANFSSEIVNISYGGEPVRYRSSGGLQPAMSIAIHPNGTALILRQDQLVNENEYETTKVDSLKEAVTHIADFIGKTAPERGEEIKKKITRLQKNHKLQRWNQVSGIRRVLLGKYGRL